MQPTLARSRWAIFLLMLFLAINFADKAIIGLAAGPMMKELGLSATQYGSIASSFYLLFSISAIVFGFLGNRISGKWLLAGLAVVWSLAQLPILLPAAGVTVLLATRILLGAGEGPGFPLATHVAFSWVPEKNRGLTAALMTIGSGLGVIVGAPLLNAAIGAYGWRAAFGILGAIGLVWVAAWLIVGGDGPYAARPAATPDQQARPETMPDQQADAVPAAEPRQPYWRLLCTGTWLGTVFSGFTVYWGLGIGIAFLPLYLGEVAGFGHGSVGFVASVPAYASIAFMLLGGGFSQWLVKRGVSRHLAQGVLGGGLALLAGVCTLLMTRVGSPALALPLIALAFGVGNAQTPLSQAAVADTVPARQRGAALGIWYAIVTVAGVVAPIVTGMLIDNAATKAAGYGLAFDLAGGLVILGGLASMLVVRPDRDAARLGTGTATSSTHRVRSVDRP
ncbi:MFS transporter [Streptomyces violens]|uniref:MFS transporter n=1 Tax=Streptomyces violens TaxID=66377 RepID=UPI0004C2A3E3|nr:MFS transporter [Streptomyces violens]